MGIRVSSYRVGLPVCFICKKRGMGEQMVDIEWQNPETEYPVHYYICQECQKPIYATLYNIQRGLM